MGYIVKSHAEVKLLQVSDVVMSFSSNLIKTRLTFFSEPFSVLFPHVLVFFLCAHNFPLMSCLQNDRKLILCLPNFPTPPCPSLL